MFDLVWITLTENPLFRLKTFFLAFLLYKLRILFIWISTETFIFLKFVVFIGSSLDQTYFFVCQDVSSVFLNHSFRCFLPVHVYFCFNYFALQIFVEEFSLLFELCRSIWNIFGYEVSYWTMKIFSWFERKPLDFLKSNSELL